MRSKTPLAAIALAAAIVLGLDRPGLGAAAGDAGPRELHIVRLAEPPLAGFRGGAAGLEATSPAVTGDDRLDVESPASIDYLAHLDRAQAQTVGAIERTIGRPVAVPDRYRIVLNGFSVWLAPAEARAVARLGGVADVHPQAIDRIATDAGPAWSGAAGVWDGTALGRPEGTLGEGIVIGIVDTGINIDHPSFAAIDDDGYEHLNPLGDGQYLGWCNPGSNNYNPSLRCNDKLIGLWSHFGSGSDPEDDNGHGSHTASTAGGNRLRAARLNGPTLSITRTISGVAPHAAIAAYDACTAEGGCPESATVAAIEQAVADGVDVINYSIQVGQDSPWLNTRSLAFLAAREAGVFVSVAAGNAGPGPGTNFANSPWVITVGNSTHNRQMKNMLVRLTGGRLTPPADIGGKGFTAGLSGPRPIVYAKGTTNVDGVVDDGRCLKPFPPDTFDSAIVVCDRGQNGRVEKGQNVLAGGASGYILANAAGDGSSLVGDAHYLPGVHISFADGEKLKHWLESGDEHAGEISGLIVDTAPANGDVMSAGSSRGPSNATQCCRRPGLALYEPALLDVLKPDVTAPGTDILAAVASTAGSTPPEFNLLSGTSMASPHTAGAAALIRAARPDWSPAAVHSALVTTARIDILKEDGVTPANPFAAGAGHIQVDAAVRAGFVIEETPERFWAADPSHGGDPTTLNLGTLHNTRCIARCTWERTLTSTVDHPVSWTPASDDGASGIHLTVEPPEFTLRPGEPLTIRITADVSDLPLDGWAFGTLLLTPMSNGLSTAHLPVAVRPVIGRIPSPVVVYAEQPTGTFAVAGLRTIAAPGLAALPGGLVRAAVKSESVVQDPTPNNAFDNPTGTLVVKVTVGADARRLVAEVVKTTARDVDMFVGRDDDGDGKPALTEQRCASTSMSPLEYCDVRSPQAGDWWIVAQNWQNSGTGKDPIDLASAVVTGASAGNLTVTAPEGAGPGAPFTAELRWQLAAIAPDERWYGAVTFADGATRLGVLSVDLIGVPSGFVAPTTAPPPPRPTVPATRTPLPATETPTATVTAEPPTPTATATRMSTATATVKPGGLGIYLPALRKNDG